MNPERRNVLRDNEILDFFDQLESNDDSDLLSSEDTDEDPVFECSQFSDRSYSSEDDSSDWEAEEEQDNNSTPTSSVTPATPTSVGIPFVLPGTPLTTQPTRGRGRGRSTRGRGIRDRVTRATPITPVSIPVRINLI